MEDDTLRLQVSRSRRNRIIAKLFFVLVVGSGIGVVVAHYDQLALQHSRTITLDEYTKGFEAYKTSLTENRWGVLPNVALFAVTMLLFFGIYELIGTALGYVITTITARREPPQP